MKTRLRSNAEEDDFLLKEPMQENYGTRYRLSTVYGIFLMNFREPGLEEGRAEIQIAIARNLKALGMNNEQIAKTTGLREEDIEGL